MIKRAGRYFDHALIAAFSNDKLKTFHQAGVCVGREDIRVERTVYLCLVPQILN